MTQGKSKKPGRQTPRRLELGKAARIGSILDEHFPWPIRSLEAPLNSTNAFTLLIAVVLSAQCTDKRVNQVTPKLFNLASTPAQMVALGQGAIEEAIKTCGLARNKARAIWQLSQMLLDRFGGQVPNTFELLELLPGVGHKTASVVMWQCFGLPAFPVDTHIFRCARRWGLSNSANVVGVERDLKACFPQKSWGSRHLQIILFARKYCPARSHEVGMCPVCSWACQSSRA